MAEILPLRDYQREGIEDFKRRASQGARRVPLVLATGLGKTVMFSHLSRDWSGLRASVDASFGRRVLVLAHTDELVNQAARKIKGNAPHLSVGIVKADLNQVYADVVVASVQSLRSAKRRAQLRDVGLIVIDECHHATAKTYRDILTHFGALEPTTDGNPPTGDFTPSVLTAGFTATLARADKAKLSDVWEECTFTRGISFGIRRGYLLDVRGKRVYVPEMNLNAVKKSGGDFQDSSLADELERTFAPEIIAKKYAEVASDRKGLVFWPTVAVAEHGAKAFEDQGIPSAVVHGKLGVMERRLLLKRLASGEIQTIHNCAVLTEGFDDPTISCVVIARPTRSAPLYQQMVGRGLRPNLALPLELRGDCLVLDVVGASRNHDLRSLVDLSEREIREEFSEDEDLSLIDMEEAELAAETGDALSETKETGDFLYSGETETADFDPLGRSTIGAWLQTVGGIYFLPAGDVYILIIPSETSPGDYDVAWLTQSPNMYGHVECGDAAPPHFSKSERCGCPSGHIGTPGDLTEHRELSLETAVSWAEEVMETFGTKALAGRKAPWRRRPVSAGMKYKALGMNIEVPEGALAGDIGDQITEKQASWRIHKVIGDVQ